MAVETVENKETLDVSRVIATMLNDLLGQGKISKDTASRASDQYLRYLGRRLFIPLEYPFWTDEKRYSWLMRAGRNAYIGRVLNSENPSAEEQARRSEYREKMTKIGRDYLDYLGGLKGYRKPTGILLYGSYFNDHTMPIPWDEENHDEYLSDLDILVIEKESRNSTLKSCDQASAGDFRSNYSRSIPHIHIFEINETSFLETISTSAFLSMRGVPHWAWEPGSRYVARKDMEVINRQGRLEKLSEAGVNETMQSTMRPAVDAIYQWVHDAWRMGAESAARMVESGAVFDSSQCHFFTRWP